MTTWSGGFGEQLDISEAIRDGDEYITIGDLLPRFRRWLFAVAYGLWSPGTGVTVEDIAQEGYIAMWRAFQKAPWKTAANPIALAQGWMIEEAKNRMRQAARTGVYFGAAKRQHGDINRGAPSLTALLDDNNGNGDDQAWTMKLVGAADLLHGAELAYHRGQITRAIEQLTPVERRYVMLRFWGGYTNAEIAVITEVSQVRVGQIWRGTPSQAGVRAKLRESLAHLASAV